MFEMRPYDRRNHMSGYDPFREMEALQRNFFENPFGLFNMKEMSAFRTDITDNGNEYILKADLPGFRKEDISLDLDGDYLSITAERHSEYEENDKKEKFLRCERSYGSYTRRFDISGVDKNGIRAKYEDGVLSLTLPKKEPGSDHSKHLEIE